MSWHPSKIPTNAVTDPPLDIRLNRQWRVTADRHQWILENRIGKGGWTEGGFFVKRERLLGRIAARCGPTLPAPMAEIAGWDEYFSVWAARRNGWFEPATRTARTAAPVFEGVGG